MEKLQPQVRDTLNTTLDKWDETIGRLIRESTKPGSRVVELDCRKAIMLGATLTGHQDEAIAWLEQFPMPEAPKPVKKSK